MVHNQRIHYKCIKYPLIIQKQMIPQNTYAIFVDNSGSTGGCRKYWATVEHLLNQYAKDISHYYLWNSTCGKSSKKQFEEFITSKRGVGGTSPERMAQEITRQKYSHVILMTDGQVSDGQVKQCDRILEEAKSKNNFSIKKAIVYVVGEYSEPDLSVTCPFTRYSDSQVFSKGGDAPLKELMNYTAEDYKILDSLEDITLQNFEAQYSKIEQLIIAQNMGKEGNLPLKNQLVAMKTKLIKELSKKLGKGDFNSKIRAMLESQDLEGSLDLMKNLATKYFQESGTGELEKKINYLISLCGDMRGQYNLGQIKSNKMATAVTAVQGQIDKNQDINDLSKNPIECPIIMDEDVPQILVDECQPFLLGVQKCIVDDINACPLRLLNYPDLKSKFKARLSTYTGVKFSDKLLKNPFTQNRLLGSIPLGCHKSHMTVGNHTIAKMVAGGKVMGNLNMYYAVIWIIVNEDEVEFLKPIKANLAEHLLYRLKNTKTMASMCGLSQFVSTQVSTDIALWYCANSGYLNNPVEKDTFRFHLFNMEPIIQMLKTLNYPIEPGFLRHYHRTLALYYFLDRYKRYNNNQRKALKLLFTGLYQKGFLVNTSNLDKKFKVNEICTQFIPVDGSADEQQIKAVKSCMPSFCKEMQRQDLLFVCNLLDQTKQIYEIVLDYNAKVPSLPEAQICWKYGLENYEHKVTICPQTVRPLSVQNGKGWAEQANELFGVPNSKQLFKGCKYMEDFIIKYKKKPSKDELAIFYYNRYQNAVERKSTLPFMTEQWVDMLIVAYQPAFPEGFDIKKIINTLKESRSMERRVELQLTQ